MRIGYPCLNLSLPCSASRTFRLRSYSDERLEQTVSSNLACLEAILSFNAENGIVFFRITSDIVPFASHRVCTFPWQERFRRRLAAIGRTVREGEARVAMHPDQFVLVNAQDKKIFEASERELVYHAELLDLMGMDVDAKIQIHVGGVYDDKAKSMARFVRRFAALPDVVRRRLVIENDDRLYGLADCMRIHAETGIPVLFDAFHHVLRNEGEELAVALALAASTWRASDGPPIVDYSSQQKGARVGTHAETIDLRDFRRFLRESRPHDFDCMLEIKDKEYSALMAIELAWEDPRLAHPRKRRR